MPYKSEKIRIAGTQYDRRIKLTPDQKEYIKWGKVKAGTIINDNTSFNYV